MGEEVIALAVPDRGPTGKLTPGARVIFVTAGKLTKVVGVVLLTPVRPGPLTDVSTFDELAE
jgi:hypothetical protein